MNTNQQNILNQMSIDKKNYTSARYSLFLLIAFTVLNSIMLIAGSNTYMLFSAYLPYSFVSAGILMSGRAPEEIYAEYEQLVGEAYPIIGDIALYIAVAFAVVIIAVYIILAVLSGKKYGFMLASTVIFGIDTLLVILDLGSGVATDLIFHVVILVLLIKGCIAGKKYFEAEKNLAQLQQNEMYQNAASEEVYAQPQNRENNYFTQNENTYFSNENTYTAPKAPSENIKNEQNSLNGDSDSSV